jgi:hypothetical protein
MKLVSTALFTTISCPTLFSLSQPFFCLFVLGEAWFIGDMMTSLFLRVQLGDIQ